MTVPRGRGPWSCFPLLIVGSSWPGSCHWQSISFRPIYRRGILRLVIVRSTRCLLFLRVCILIKIWLWLAGASYCAKDSQNSTRRCRGGGLLRLAVGGNIFGRQSGLPNFSHAFISSIRCVSRVSGKTILSGVRVFNSFRSLRSSAERLLCLDRGFKVHVLT